MKSRDIEIKECVKCQQNTKAGMVSVAGGKCAEFMTKLNQIGNVMTKGRGHR